jgi:hypothetical protein
MLRNYGQSDKHVHDREGLNMRLDELQGLPAILPDEAPWAHHVCQLFVIRSKERGVLRGYVSDHRITMLIHYPTPITFRRYINRWDF